MANWKGRSNVASIADRRVAIELLQRNKIYPASQNLEVAEQDLYAKGSDVNHSSRHFGALPLAYNY